MDKSLAISVIAVLIFSEAVLPAVCESDTQDYTLFNEIFLESQKIPQNDTLLQSRESIVSNSTIPTLLNPPRCRCVEVSACNQSNQISDDREQTGNGGSDILGIVNLRVDIHQCQNTSEVCCDVSKAETIVTSAKGPPNVTISAGDSHWKHRRCGQFKDGQQGGFPWIVSVAVENVGLGHSSQSDSGHVGGSSYKFLCFGSLIHPSVVLTTADCVFKAANSADRNSMRVIESTSKNGSRSQSHIREVIFHNELYRKRFQFDLALLILDKEVLLSSELDTVCLPSIDNDGTYFESMICSSTIGGDDRDRSTGNGLNKIEGFILTRKQCEAKLRKTSLGQSFQLHESLLCVEVNNPTTPANINETCEIGNGAPLVCKHGPSGYFIQVGIASWNLNYCNDTAVPIVYVNLPYLASWIRGKIRGNHFDSKYFTLVDDDLLMRIGLLKTK